MVVLVVEDNVILAKNIARGLKQRKLECVSVASGKAAMDYLAVEQISAMCLDIDLPDCNGLDLLKTINANFEHVPVLIMTGNGGPPERLRASTLGAAAFFYKPFVLSDLLELLQCELQKRDRARKTGLMEQTGKTIQAR